MMGLLIWDAALSRKEHRTDGIIIASAQSGKARLPRILHGKEQRPPCGSARHTNSPSAHPRAPRSPSADASPRHSRPEQHTTARLLANTPRKCILLTETLTASHGQPTG